MNGVSKLRNTLHYNLRLTSHFSTDPIHSVYNGTEKKLKNGNVLSVHVKFVRLLYQI